MSALPPKLYFRIGEVAGLVGVEPHVLRYWEREFRSIRPTKSAKGQRVYSRRDVENLMRVRELLYAEGFTIAGAKKKLQKNGFEPDAAPKPQRVHEARFEADADPSYEAEVQVAAEQQHAAPARKSEVAPARVRETLVELRSEIEAFLTEIGG